MSGDAKISQKGTKTRARAATHSARLVTDQACPICGCRHILTTISSKATADYWCGACGGFFNTPAEPTRVGR